MLRDFKKVNGSTKNQSGVLAPPDSSTSSILKIEDNGFVRSRLQYQTEPAVEIESAEFDDGTMLDVIFDPNERRKTAFAIYKNASVRIESEYLDHGCCYRPFKRQSIPAGVILPVGVRNYGSVTELAKQTGEFLKSVAKIPEDIATLLEAFVLCSWVADPLPIAPHIILVGAHDFSWPILRALSLVCRRALTIGDANQSGLLDACSRFHPTLLVLDCGLRRDAIRNLKMGMRRDLSFLQKGSALSCFGPKLIAMSEPPTDEDLLGGSLLVSLQPTRWPSLSTFSDQRVSQSAEDLQMRLLKYRFDHLKSTRPAQLGSAANLLPKARDLVSCLSSPFAEDKDLCAKVVTCVRNSCIPTKRIPAHQHAVLSALFYIVHEPNKYTVKVGELAEIANKILAQQDEGPSISPKKCGSILTGFGFPDRERTDEGYGLEINEYVREKIHLLVSLYGRFEFELYSSRDPLCMCEWCRRFQLVTEKDILWYEQELRPQKERRKRREELERQAKIDKLRKNPRKLFASPKRGALEPDPEAVKDVKIQPKDELPELPVHH